MALALWLGLGLGRKPEERPEVEEGERDGAALLLGVLRGLLEVEQPRAGSWRTVGWLLACHNKKKKTLTSRIIPNGRSVFVSHLLAPFAGQLLLCRHLFCWCSLRFGLLVGVEADFLHLRSNRAKCERQPHCMTTGSTCWVEIFLYLLVPSLPPLVSRHGWSCAHRIWVKVIMKLLAWTLEDSAARTDMHTWKHHPNKNIMSILTEHTPCEGLGSWLARCSCLSAEARASLRRTWHPTPAWAPWQLLASRCPPDSGSLKKGLEREKKRGGSDHRRGSLSQSDQTDNRRASLTLREERLRGRHLKAINRRVSLCRRRSANMS